MIPSPLFSNRNNFFDASHDLPFCIVLPTGSRKRTSAMPFCLRCGQRLPRYEGINLWISLARRYVCYVFGVRSGLALWEIVHWHKKKPLPGSNLTFAIAQHDSLSRQQSLPRSSLASHASHSSQAPTNPSPNSQARTCTAVSTQARMNLIAHPIFSSTLSTS
jgi:hypothetical protein